MKQLGIKLSLDYGPFQALETSKCPDLSRIFLLIETDLSRSIMNRFRYFLTIPTQHKI